MNETICITSLLNTNKSNEVRCIRVHLIMLYLWIFSNKSEQLETHLVSTFCVSIHDLCAQTSSTNECEHIVFTKIHFSILYFGTCMLKRFIWNVLFVIRMNIPMRKDSHEKFSAFWRVRLHEANIQKKNPPLILIGVFMSKRNIFIHYSKWNLC